MALARRPAPSIASQRHDDLKKRTVVRRLSARSMSHVRWRAATSVLGPWAECVFCAQSATGQYLGVQRCYRCASRRQLVAR